MEILPTWYSLFIVSPSTFMVKVIKSGLACVGMVRDTAIFCRGYFSTGGKIKRVPFAIFLNPERPFARATSI